MVDAAAFKAEAAETTFRFLLTACSANYFLNVFAGITGLECRLMTVRFVSTFMKLVKDEEHIEDPQKEVLSRLTKRKFWYHSLER